MVYADRKGVQIRTSLLGSWNFFASSLSERGRKKSLLYSKTLIFEQNMSLVYLNGIIIYTKIYVIQYMITDFSVSL